MAFNNMSTKEILETISYKLNKYINNKDNNKISLYLDNLSNVKDINADVLKTVNIVDCLKSLKKQNNGEYSKKAGDIISKWKELIKAQENNNNNSVHNSSNTDTKSASKVKHEKHQETSEEMNTSLKKQKLSLNDYKTTKSESNLKPSEQSRKSANNNPKNNDLVPLPTISLDTLLDLNEFKPTTTTTTTTHKPVQSNGYSTISNTNNSSSSSSAPAAPQHKYGKNLLKDDEDLSRIMKSKHSARVLYTGRKNFDPSNNQVPKLFDLCTKVLIENLDILPNRIYHYNNSNSFPIAFEPIKQVLERTNAKQLEMIEYYGPNLTEDTDPIWEKICSKEFKNINMAKETEHFRGAWKEFYFRKLDEREQKYKQVKDKLAMKTVDQKRQTQMATVRFVSESTKKVMPLSSNTKIIQSSIGDHGKVSVSNGSSVPVRKILHDSGSSMRRGGGFSSAVGPKKTVPSVSAGMKKTMKLIKSCRR